MSSFSEMARFREMANGIADIPRLKESSQTGSDAFDALGALALATIFAVLAARPDVSRQKYSPKEFRQGKAHLLVFEDFSDLSEKQYVDAMSRMLGNDDQVYRNMISHVHELGSTADWKYRKLHCSYNVFIGGIVLSVVSLLILEGMKWTNHLPHV